jgi:pimeloyl-ACP methyl ester carboxylesterase
MSKSMVLIHGAWLSARSWENFADYFTRKGYDVEVPEWPRKHGDVEELRRNASELAGLGVAEIVDHYDRMLRGRSPQPILIGHSFGGLFVQLLLDRGLGAAGVALDPAAPKGVLTIAPSTLKAASPALLHPSSRKGSVTLTFDEFNYGFTNTFDADAARAAYERYAVPETGRIFFEDGLANFTWHSPVELDYRKNDRAPLLITSAEHDRVVPRSSARANYNNYRHSTAITEFMEFPARPHLLMVGKGWEEVASAVNDWLNRVLSDPRARSAADSDQKRF